MVKRALIERRPWLLASLFFAVSWWWIVAGGPMPGAYQIAWKGAAVGLLAVYAFQRHLGRTGLVVSAVMALSAIGDAASVLEIESAGALHALAHALAVALFAANRRASPVFSQKATGAALAIGVPLLTWLLTLGMDGRGPIVAYAALLGIMAGTAWLSRFTRYRVGAGAVLYAVSELLLVAAGSVLASVAWVAMLVWPAYYVGQLLIVTGVMARLRKEKAV